PVGQRQRQVGGGQNVISAASASIVGAAEDDVAADDSDALDRRASRRQGCYAQRSIDRQTVRIPNQSVSRCEGRNGRESSAIGSGAEQPEGLAGGQRRRGNIGKRERS